MQPEDLKALRKSAGMSQSELAEAIGMSLDSISRMERGIPGYPIERRTELAVKSILAVTVVRARLSSEIKVATQEDRYDDVEKLTSALSILSEPRMSADQTIYNLVVGVAHYGLQT